MSGELMSRLCLAVAKVMERRVSEFNSQELANTTWAFATVKHREDKLFTALARTAERRMSDFNAQGLANTAWACATIN